jgi:hypothetical protein
MVKVNGIMVNLLEGLGFVGDLETLASWERWKTSWNSDKFGGSSNL